MSAEEQLRGEGRSEGNGVGETGDVIGCNHREE
jgi:hypothetical protein